MRFLYQLRVPLLFAALLLSACGEEDIDGGGAEPVESCRGQERLNPITGRCELVAPGEGEDPGESSVDENQVANQNQPPGPDGDSNSGPGEDSNAGPGEDPTPGVNEDYCSPHMNPDSELDCSFYAHTPSTLYRIDPFRKTIETLREVPEGLTDIDTHPDGMLYGITFTELYRFEADSSGWDYIGELSPPSSANGLCIDGGGEAFMTAGDSLYRLDLETAQVTKVGSMGILFSSISSSGDCVFDKGGRLFMSSTNSGMSSGDNLVAIDQQNARAQVIGNTGYEQIYGLTSAWGILFGTTGNGEVIQIDRDTGRGELIYHPPGDLLFHGAASTPAR